MSIAIHIASELMVALIKYNLEMNPAVSGRPARLNEQRTKQKKVMGIALPRPDKLFIVTLFLIKGLAPSQILLQILHFHSNIYPQHLKIV